MARETDVTLRISTETDGGQNIKALVAQLNELAAQGGDAAPELQRLAQEIAELEKARQAAEAFEKLSTASTELALKLGVTEQNARALAPAIEKAAAETTRLQQAESEAKTALAAAQSEVKAQERALRDLTKEKKQAGVDAAQLAQKENELSTALTNAKAAVVAQETAYKAAKEATRAAKQAQSDYVSEMSRAEGEVARLSKQLDQQALKLAESSKKAGELGVDTSKLAAEQGRLAEETKKATQYITHLQSEMDRASNAAKVLAQQNADEEIRQAAIASEKAAQYTRWWADALNQAEVEARQLKQINLDEEMRQQAIASQKAAEYTRWWADALNQAEREARQAAQATQALNASTVAANKEVKQTGFFASASAKALGTLAAITSGYEIAKQFLVANIELQRTERAFKAITGSAAQAAQEMQFVRRTADQLGVSVYDVAESYKGLLAASKGTTLEGAKAREIFQSVSNALGQTGASAYASSRAFTAITQIVSKGTVSMEEMRQQLAEALPGAFQAASRGLGVTDAELMKLISSGQLAAEDMLPAFAKALNDTYGKGNKSIEGLEQSWNRLKQSLTDTSTTVGESGGLKLLAALADGAAVAIRSVTANIRVYAGTVKLVGESLGTLGGAFVSVATGSEKAGAAMSHVADSMGTSWRKFTEYLVTGRNKVYEVTDATKAATIAADLQADAQKRAVSAATTLDGAQQALNAGTLQLRLAQLEAAKATIETAGAAMDAGARWTKLSLSYAEAREAAEVYARATETLAAAKQEEAKAQRTVVGLTGDESQAKIAAARTASELADALQLAAEARQREVTLLREEIALKAQDAESGEKQKKIQALREELAAKEAVAEKSRQLFLASAAEAAQTRLTGETYKDNSAKLGVYAAEMAALNLQVEQLRIKQAQGLATEQEVLAARLKASEATALYKDSLNDVVAAKQREGALANQLAALGGSEAERLNTAAAAAQNTAAAVGLMSEARRQEAQAIQDQLTRLDAQAAAQGGYTDALARIRGELTQNLALKREEITISDRVTSAAKLEAEQARVKAEAYKDNSARLWEYKAAAEGAEAELTRLQAAHAAGKATEAEVTEGRIKAAGALALYRDALKDVVEAQEAKITKLRAAASVEQAMLQLELEQARTAEKNAIAQGNEKAAIEAKIRQKEIEIRIMRAKMEADRLEAAASVAKVEAERKEAEATGTLTEAKKAELEARLAAAKVKALEAERGAELIKQLEEEVRAIGRVKEAKQSAASSSSSSSGGSGGGGGAGGAGGAGDARTATGEPLAALVDFERLLYQQGGNVDDVQAAMQYVNAMFRQLSAQNPITNWRDAGRTINMNIEEAARQALARARRERNGDTRGSGTSGGNVAADTGNLLKQNPLQPVTININGKAQQLNVGSTEDASMLSDILRQLTTDAKRY